MPPSDQFPEEKSSVTGVALDRDEGRLQEELILQSAHLGRDELRVLVMLAKRLRAGAMTYGRLDIASDARVWRKEMLDELLDGLVYGSIELAKEGT